MFDFFTSLFDALTSVVGTILGSKLALVVLLVPLFVNLVVRFVNLLGNGLVLERRPKHNSSCSDWEEQFDRLVSEHDKSVQNVKSILEENKY